MEDLWPEEIENNRVKSPVAILREQATFLGERTKNIVQAEVVDNNSSIGSFNYYFYIVAPALGNYRYQLLGISHDISLYPTQVNVEESILDEIRPNVKVDDIQNWSFIVAESEEEFVGVLKAVFRAKKTLRVIIALLSQSDPNWKPEDEIPF